MFSSIERRFHKLSVRLNRPLWPRQSLQWLSSAWGADALLNRLSTLQPDLLVTITTYRRPADVSVLLASLAEVLGTSGVNYFVCVLNDASDADCSEAQAGLKYLFGERAAWLDASEKFGKLRFWCTHQMIFFAAKAAKSAHLLSLQDDVELAPDFLQRLWTVWSDTGKVDPRRRVLYLFSGNDDEPEGRWHHFQRVDFSAIGARRTDWFDLQAFLIDRAGLTLLKYWMIPIPPSRWKRDPTISSGVGQQLTLRMAGRGTTFQCHPPLVSHGRALSQMNPEARALRPLDNRGQLA